MIPAHRETARLPHFLADLVPTLAEAPWRTEILIVDDGSSASEQAALVAMIHPRRHGACVVLPPLLLADNRRKGGAILAGWRQPAAAKADWLAFVDADGAVPANEIRRVLATAFAGSRDHAWFAVRDADSVRHRRPIRRIASRAFAWWVSITLGERWKDTQCGFKIIPAAAFPTIDSDDLDTSGFSFDVALLVALRRRGIAITTVPITWYEEPGSHAHLWRRWPAMAAAVWRLTRTPRDL